MKIDRNKTLKTMEDVSGYFLGDLSSVLQKYEIDKIIGVEGLELAGLIYSHLKATGRLLDSLSGKWDVKK